MADFLFAEYVIAQVAADIIAESGVCGDTNDAKRASLDAGRKSQGEILAPLVMAHYGPLNAAIASDCWEGVCAAMLWVHPKLMERYSLMRLPCSPDRVLSPD
jgi:hypothetical protein